MERANGIANHVTDEACCNVQYELIVFIHKRCKNDVLLRMFRAGPRQRLTFGIFREVSLHAKMWEYCARFQASAAT